MNRKYSKSKYLLATTCIALLLISIICSVFISINQESKTVAETTKVASGTASVVNLDADGNLTDYFSSIITGAQNESIYFGENNADFFTTGTGNDPYIHTGAVKWRVLSKSDTKYSDGNMLLLADYSIGRMAYNPYYENPYYAFWGTSQMRAMLNGGDFLSTVANTTTAPSLTYNPTDNNRVDASDSWYNQLFTEQEKISIVASKSYTTTDWGFGTSSPYFKTTGITGTGEGQYSTTVLNATTGAAKYVTTKSNSVIETTSGDYLFLLDYYDINNTAYGFGDSGQVYAKKVNSSWTSSSGFYPGYNDNKDITSEYLKPSSDAYPHWWLRSAGRNGNSLSRVILVNGSGFITYTHVANAHGVRPAFNFNPSSVIYATAAANASNGTTLASVSSVDGTTPAYKVYLRADNFKNYNQEASGAPSISKSSSGITVTKSGQTGSAVILLTDKNGNGEVAYQAIAPFEGGVAKASVPSGVNVNDFAVTVLFLDNVRGGNFAETVTASYTTAGVALPKDVEVTYNGKLRTLADFASESWYNANVYDNASKMSVSIPSNAIHQGTYTVTFTLVDSDLEWADGTKSQKTITLTIKPKEVGLKWSTDSDTGILSVIADDTDICPEDKGAGSTPVIVTRYRGRGSTTWDSLSKPNKIGSYTASAEVQNSDYTIKSGETMSKNFELESIKVPMLTQSNFSPSTSQEYNGSYRNFVIIEYDGYRLEGATDDVPVEIVIPDEFKNTLTISNGIIRVADSNNVANANTYALTLKLTDPVNTEWADRVGQSNNTEDRVFEFSITQKELKGSIISGAINAVLGNKATISLEMEDGNYPYAIDTDKVAFDVKAYLNGSGNGYPVASGIKLEYQRYDYNIEIDTSGLPIAGNYVLKFQAAEDGNYKVTIPDLSMSVTEGGGDEANVVWRLRDENGVQIALKRTPVGTLNAQFDNVDLTYTNGKSYTVTATYPTATYELDTNAEGGFVAGYKDNSGSNAGEYTTQIKLRNKTTNTTEIYTITWSIAKAKFELGGVNWKGNGKVEYTGSSIDMVLENLPEGLSPNYGGVLRGNAVGVQGGIRVDSFTLTGDYVGNYEEPIQGNNNSYTGTFTWEIDWEITQAVIAVGLNSNWKIQEYTDAKGNKYNIYVLADTRADGVVEYDYYEADNRNNIIGETPLKLEEIEYSSTQAKYYKAYPKLIDTVNYKFTDGVSESAKYSPFFTVGGGSNEITVGIESDTLEYNSLPRNVKLEILGGSGATLRDFTLTYYKGDVANEANKLDGAPIDQGNYLVVVKSNKESVVLSGDTQFRFKIVAAVIEKDWNKNTKPYVLKLEYGQINGVEYEIRDKNTGEIVEYSQLQAGNSYEIRAKIKDRNNYSFESEDEEHKYVTEWEEFELREEDIPNMTDPNDPLNPNYPQVDPNAPETQDPDDNNPGSGDIGSGDDGDPDKNNNGGFNADNIEKFLKEYWQVIVSSICILLIMLFVSKTASYESKRKRNKKKADKLESSMFAATVTGLFGWASKTWTAIACVFMALTVASFVIMLIAKSRYNKSEDELEETKERYDNNKESSRRDYDDNRREEDERRREEEYRRREDEFRQREEEMRKRDDDLKAMFMRMMGGNYDGGMGQGMSQGAYAGAQQGIGADEIRGIVSETVTALLPGMQQALPQQASVNDEVIKSLIEEQKAMRELVQQLAEKPAEKVIEKEVVATSANDETIKQMLSNQEKLMEKILELSNNQPMQVIAPQPQIIEKVVEKPVEKIVEKVVEKPVVHVISTDKSNVISTEAVGGAEKSKQIKKGSNLSAPIEVTGKKVEKSQPPKKAPAPRLTLAEAYAQLTKEQKKFFDGLREYAMKKDSKCKEKLATYFTTIGPSTTNPLIKLTIKKGITVALFKMEDEYLKDIRRNAGSDGTKVKVKETEVAIGDSQAYDTAKDMVDLRVDQIERYNDYLKEQRSLRRK